MKQITQFWGGGESPTLNIVAGMTNVVIFRKL